MTQEVEFAGFKQQVETLEEILCIKIRDQQLQNIKGVLVHGPPGIGKTFAVATVLRRFSQLLQGKTDKKQTEESKDDEVKISPPRDDLCVIRLTPADLINASKNES